MVRAKITDKFNQVHSERRGSTQILFSQTWSMWPVRIGMVFTLSKQICSGHRSKKIDVEVQRSLQEPDTQWLTMINSDFESQINVCIIKSGTDPDRSEPIAKDRWWRLPYWTDPTNSGTIHMKTLQSIRVLYFCPKVPFINLTYVTRSRAGPRIHSSTLYSSKTLSTWKT
jgi:hypothetical protein